jgi:hypothetical protein
VFTEPLPSTERKDTITEPLSSNDRRDTQTHKDWWERFMKYAVEMGSGAMIYIVL